MTLYVREAGSTGRPLGDNLPVAGYDDWLKIRKAEISAERKRSEDAGNDYTSLAHMNLVCWDRAFQPTAYTNVRDPEQGRQEGLIAKVLSAAGVVDTISKEGVPERTWPKEDDRRYHVARLEIEYAAAVELLSHYAGVDPAAIVRAGDDQDAVILAARGGN